MARTKGSVDINDSGFLLRGQFDGLPPDLRVWNICCVFLNLGRISESLAQRYLEMNLRYEDTAKAYVYLEKIQRQREPLFGSRKGDDTRDCVFRVRRFK